MISKIKKLYEEITLIEKLFILVCLSFPLVVTIYFIYRKYEHLHYAVWIGDYSNWFQAFIAMFTLLAVMYTARKTSLIAHDSNEVAKNSVEVAERDFNTKNLVEISRKINDLINNLDLKKLESAPEIQHGDFVFFEWFCIYIRFILNIIGNKGGASRQYYLMVLSLNLNREVLSEINSRYIFNMYLHKGALNGFGFHERIMLKADKDYRDIVDFIAYDKL